MRKLILLLLLIPLISLSQEKEFDFNSVERIPIYPGCEVNMKNQQLRNCFQKKIQTHINKNFRYPKIAQRRKIEGRVFVQFIIGTEGYIDWQEDLTLSLRLRQKE